MNETANKNNFFQKDTTKKILAAFITAFLGLLVGFLVLFFTKLKNPNSSLNAFKGLITGGYKIGAGRLNLGKLDKLLYDMTPLILTGLSLAIGMKTGLFNIGASGQYQMGILGLFVALNIIPQDSKVLFNNNNYSFNFGYFLIIILFVLLFSGLTGALIGFLKAYFNVSEVISGIMINYISMYTITKYIQKTAKIYNTAMGRAKTLGSVVLLPGFGVKQFKYTSIAIIISILIAVLVYVFLNKTKFGKEIQMVGKNKHASKYAGIKENKSIILIMIICSTLAGLAGGLYMLSSTYSNYSIAEVIQGVGFDGIVVSLIAFNNPIGIIFSTMFITHIKNSSQVIQQYGYKKELVDVIVGVILFFVSLSFYFISKKYGKNIDDMLFKKTNDELREDIKLIEKENQSLTNKNKDLSYKKNYLIKEISLIKDKFKKNELKKDLSEVNLNIKQNKNMIKINIKQIKLINEIILSNNKNKLNNEIYKLQSTNKKLRQKNKTYLKDNKKNPDNSKIEANLGYVRDNKLLIKQNEEIILLLKNEIKNQKPEKTFDYNNESLSERINVVDGEVKK